MKTMVDDTLLMDYASGALAEPVALAVAAHLALHPEAGSAYRMATALGGQLLEDLDGEPVSDAALDALLDRLDEPESPSAVRRPGFDDTTRALVPEVLQPYLPRSLDALDWKRIGMGVEEARLSTASSGYRVSLLRIKPGQAMPRHSHRGCEYTVVLDGSYCDGGTIFARGDFCEADAADQHQPTADAKTGCLCLIVLDQPVKLSGPMGWVVNPFLKN